MFACAVCVGALSAAAAQPATGVPTSNRPIMPGPTETDQGPAFFSTLNALKYFSLYDPIAGRELVVPQLPVYYDTPLHPVITFTIKTNGADIAFTYTNTTAAPARLGTVALTGIQFPEALRFWQFGQDTKVLQWTSYNQQAIDTYPGQVYSPVTIIGDGVHTLGLSLLYPTLLYDQPVQKFVVASTSQAGGGRSWAAGFRLNADLMPGATRTYTMTVRAIRGAQNWLSMIVPYRNYFQAAYGPVRYQRDARPVLGQAVSYVDLIAPANPRGFSGANHRPDIHGWRPWADHLRVLPALGGFSRVMLWTASGVFDQSPLNFPFQFMTGLLSLPNALGTLHELTALTTDPGLELGFWWGHSINVMQGWNPQTGHVLNPYNQQDVELAFAEIDMAASVGATTTGLDAFKLASPAANYYWLRLMQARCPQMKFVSENAASDLYHNLAPTFHEARNINQPHILADLLNPGHETWAAITGLPTETLGLRNVQPIEPDTEVGRVQNLGYIALTYGWSAQPFRSLSAPSGPSAEWTIPEDIRKSDISRTMKREHALNLAPPIPPEMLAFLALPRKGLPLHVPARAEQPAPSGREP
ncbi:MAG: hypothetical protein ACKVS8_05150 [Phycisphaerales bacterium]